MTGTIALVGMACRYPDAESPKALWENVLTKRRAFRQIPPERLNLADYFSEDQTLPDHIYCNQAAVIEGYQFDRVKYRIVGSTYRSADLAHWLALDIAAQALEDAGFPNANRLPKERTGVLVGNTLTGEFSRAELMRLRWPYVRRVIDAQLQQHHWDQNQRQAFLTQLEAHYKQPFEPIGEESLAGGLSNTIAGRICNHFDLGGGGYTLDGACCSSLLAIANACSALIANDIDAALVGGVDLSLDPFELIGFSKTGAFAPTQMRVYDAASNGFWPGEGCGFVVLMRYEDALALGARCYALIQGWGISSDGSGGITRPEVKGQRLALERAYQRAGYGIETISLFEGHGTGTTVGDEVELNALIAARQASAHADVPPAALGSIKANLGHTKAAAGIVGLIKATLAVHNQVLPPATGVEHPHPLLKSKDASLRLLSQAQVWPTEQPLRAGVSSFGFGGINVHLTIEGINQPRRSQLTLTERRLLTSAQDQELFLFSAEDLPTLIHQFEQLLKIAPRLSLAELTDLAATLGKQNHSHPVRAALIAATPQQLTDKIKYLHGEINVNKNRLSDIDAGIFFSNALKPARITFLFPGQASPVRLQGGAFAQRFMQIATLYQQADLVAQNDLTATAIAQPAIITAELAGLQLLTALGISARLALGHSLGEFTALHWAGVMDQATLLKLAKSRGQAMTDLPNSPGAMLSLNVASHVAETLCANLAGVNAAAFNSPTQTVISGEQQAIYQLQQRAQTQGFKATQLPVSQGFHSALMKPAAAAFEAHLVSAALQPPQRRVISTITGTELLPKTDLVALLKTQLTQPVLFTEALNIVLPETDFFIEVGPGAILTDLVRQQSDCPVITLDAAGSSLQGLLTALGAAYVTGIDLNYALLFGNRFTRPFSLDWQPQFFVNPCELAPLPDDTLPPVVASTATPVAVPATATKRLETQTSEAGELSVIERLRRKVADRTELPLQAIVNDSRLLADLHLNSISVGQIVVEVGRELGLRAPVDPTAYATATLNQIAQAMEERLTTGEVEMEPAMTLPPGVDAWVRVFTVEHVERSLRGVSLAPRGQHGWQVVGYADHPLKVPLEQRLNHWGGGGVALCLPEEINENHVGMMLEAAQAILESVKERHYLVMVQHNSMGAAAFARTFYHEQPNVTVCVITLPPVSNDKGVENQLLEKTGFISHHEAVEHVLAEVQIAKGYHEVRYDVQGIRTERVLKLLPLPSKAPAALPFSAEDVLLVSGGGKGITAECATALARDSGVRLVLLGRAAPDRDSELLANLERLQTLGVDFKYLQADVTDASAVKAAVAEVVSEWGPITGLLHGAGANQPTLIQQLDEVACQRTLAPKVGGLRHLLAALDPKPLRHLISFGSIIAPAGMPGEADYALANEWLAALTAAFQHDHPHCRCLTLEWTVWAEVGMGRRLGSDEVLAQRGIVPIPPDVGVKVFLQAVAAADWPTTVVVTGRMPAMPTLPFDQVDLPFFRFLEHPRVYYPGIELVVEAEVSSTSDPYLSDHVFDGQPVLPAVLALEAMGQVAATVLGVEAVPQFEEVAFSRPVVVGENQSERVQVAALVRDKGKVEVVLRCAQTGFRVDHFRAVCWFGRSVVSEVPLPAFEGYSVDLESVSELYGELWFQTGRFQRVQSYRYLEALRCEGEIATDDSRPWFGRYLPPTLLLGEPGSRDAAIHGIQVCVPHAQLLPVGIERLSLVEVNVEGPWVFSALERWREGDLFCYDMVLRGQDGQLREIWEGLRLQKVSPIIWFRDWIDYLVGPYVERRLQELLLGVFLRVALHRSGAEKDLFASDEVIKGLLGSEIEVVRRPDGKLEVLHDDFGCSVAHGGDFSLVIGGKGNVACDLEPVIERDELVWGDLLGVHSDLVGVVSEQMGEDRVKSATRVWTALECLKKGGELLETPLVFRSCEEDGWLLLGAGEGVVASWVFSMRGGDSELALAVLVG